MPEHDQEELAHATPHKAPIETGTLHLGGAIDAARPTPAMVDKILGAKREAKGPTAAPMPKTTSTEAFNASLMWIAQEAVEIAKTFDAVIIDSGRDRMASEENVKAAMARVERLQSALAETGRDIKSAEVHGTDLATPLAVLESSAAKLHSSTETISRAYSNLNIDPAAFGTTKVAFYADVGIQRGPAASHPISFTGNELDTAVRRNVEAAVNHAIKLTNESNVQEIDNHYAHAFANARDALELLGSSPKPKQYSALVGIFTQAARDAVTYMASHSKKSGDPLNGIANGLALAVK